MTELMTEMEAIHRITARGDLKVLGLPVDDLTAIYQIVNEWRMKGGRPSMIEELRERVLLEEKVRFYEQVEPERQNVHETAVIGGNAQWRGKETTYPAVISPTATVGPLTQIDAGCERTTFIGPDTQIMGMVHIGHGVQIGERCDIATGVVIAGEVTVGNDVRIGIGALLKPYIKVGDGARIGMGAVCLRDIPAGEVWAGNPARQLPPSIDMTALEVLREANGIT